MNRTVELPLSRLNPVTVPRLMVRSLVWTEAGSIGLIRVSTSMDVSGGATAAPAAGETDVTVSGVAS